VRRAKGTTQSRSVNELCRFPVNREKVTLDTRLTHFGLPMAAGQANRSYLPNLDMRFFTQIEHARCD